MFDFSGVYRGNQHAACDFVVGPLLDWVELVAASWIGDIYKLSS